ncbi:MAG: Holliday junction resolvase RuvX [Candidatus Saganbacteria bacterium]|nr:Holliday junction resolvase RuvX [Candidatus Saganbacteria bacterium]
MRILCLDYGEKRIGVAVSDPLGLTAQPVTVLSKQANFEKDLAGLKKIIDQYDQVSEIVIGLPKTMKGEIGPAAKKTIEFIDFLKEKLTIPIITWDERLTTVSASRLLQDAGMNTRKQRKVIDKVAATIILRSYMERRK